MSGKSRTFAAVFLQFETMKKAFQIICAVAVITLMGSCGNKNQYVINGTVADMNGMTVYLVCDGKDAPVDSAIVADGTFTFTGTVEEVVPKMIKYYKQNSK